MTKREKMARDKRWFIIWNNQAMNRYFWKLANKANYVETVLGYSQMVRQRALIP